MFHKNELKIWPDYQIGHENYLNVSEQLSGFKVCLRSSPFMHRTPSGRRKIMTLYNFLSLVVRHKCMVLYWASLSPFRSAIHSHKFLRLLNVSLAPLACSVNAKFFKPTFLVMSPRNVNCLLLIVNIGFILVPVFFKTSPLFICSICVGRTRSVSIHLLETILIIDLGKLLHIPDNLDVPEQVRHCGIWSG